MFLEALGIFVPSGSNHANVEAIFFFYPEGNRKAYRKRNKDPTYILD